MKYFVLVLAQLVSFTAWSAVLDWSDLEVGPKYHLNADIQFENGYILKKDTPLVLQEAIAMQAPIIYLAFRNIICTDPTLTADLSLFNPEPDDLDNNKSVGVLLDTDCILGVYVEPRFYYNKSFLRQD